MIYTSLTTQLSNKLGTMTRRTVIVGLNTAHNVLEKRLGIEVTPETITEYLETGKPRNAWCSSSSRTHGRN